MKSKRLKIAPCALRGTVGKKADRLLKLLKPLPRSLCRIVESVFQFSKPHLWVLFHPQALSEHVMSARWVRCRVECFHRFEVGFSGGEPRRSTLFVYTFIRGCVVVDNAQARPAIPYARQRNSLISLSLPAEGAAYSVTDSES